MALFPTVEETQALPDLAAIHEWGGLSSQNLAAVEQCTGSLDNAIRNVALLPAPV